MADPESATTGQARAHPGKEQDFGRKKPRLDDVGTPKKQVSKHKKSRAARKRDLNPEPYSPEDVLHRDIIQIIGKEVVDKALVDGSAKNSPLQFHDEVELEILSISSGGDGLALAPTPHPPWVVVVPFCLPGEKVRAKVYRSGLMHSLADLVEVVTPNNELRDQSRVQCKYFGTCAGCQYQMVSYETQLGLKRDAVVKAFKNFSDLPESSLPEIGSTIGSPLQYGYRTKITPHFEAPRQSQRQPLDLAEPTPEWLKIGFNKVGTRTTMDIEDCPIATKTIRDALTPMREGIISKIHTYKRGVSLLLRDSLDMSDLASSLDKHVCITDQKAIVREQVGGMSFEYQAGSFFQNNNSVLEPLTTYVKNAIFAHTSVMPTHLVDAYCGAGLFSIMLSPHFEVVTGIELSADSIRFATRNAELNNIPKGKCTFRAGDAANIFATVKSFPPGETVLIIDPPRKGCDENFIRQLVEFKCNTVVYVSCNVHTQARDIGMILKKMEGHGDGKTYVVESLRGIDLFPQTAHVESVAILRLVSSDLGPS
ncbi:tRNA methyltransferase [Pleurotus eryngii]|uniref:tRNA methyltransferase n=1 Tax=Pleurotus eryngii TaxID=5323 RepID=A0A9P5ZRZ6_PLEER|nr:tRNA methyltransferase [Pleurotus eryngii]